LAELENPKVGTFSYHWYKGLYLLLFNKLHLCLIVIVSSCYTFFYVKALFNTPNANPNGVAIYMLQHTIALFLIPVMSLDEQQKTIAQIFQSYRNLIFANLRLIYASLIFFIPITVAMSLEAVGAIPRLGEGSKILFSMPFILVAWIGYLHSVPLDYHRLNQDYAPEILQKPMRYFTGWGPAFWDALLVRLFLGIPIYLATRFATELVRGPYETTILIWLATFGEFLMHFLIIILIVERMHFKATESLSQQTSASISP